MKLRDMRVTFDATWSVGISPGLDGLTYPLSLRMIVSSQLAMLYVLYIGRAMYRHIRILPSAVAAHNDTLPWRRRGRGGHGLRWAMVYCLQRLIMQVKNVTSSDLVYDRGIRLGYRTIN